MPPRATDNPAHPSAAPPAPRPRESMTTTTSHFVALALLALPCLPGCIVPENAEPSVGVGSEVATHFVHRGMTQNERFVVQPSVDLSLPTIDEDAGGSIGGTVWANADLKNSTGSAWMPDGHAGRFTQFDVTVDYSRDVGPVRVKAGFHSYNPTNGMEFQNGERGSTTEIFVTGSMEVLEANPYLSLRYDFDEVRSSYIRFGIAEEIPLDEAGDWTLLLDGSLAYSASAMSAWNYGVDESGLADLRGSAILRYQYDPRTALTAGVHGSSITDGTIDDWFSQLGIDDDVVWASLGVRWDF